MKLFIAMDKTYFFTLEQGNFLIRLILAHLVVDFIIQPKTLSENKKWFSKLILFHIITGYIITGLLTGWWLLGIIIACLHFLIEGVNLFALSKINNNISSIADNDINNSNELNKNHRTLEIFICKQLLHLIILSLCWAFQFSIYPQLQKAFFLPIINYSYSLILLSYIIVIGPLGWFIKLLLSTMSLDSNSDSNEKGGKIIGVFERIIILTLVLIGEYEAIGFLITGKSIIRFVDGRNGNLKSEYVLVGTMSSYALSILIGVIVKWLL